MTDTSQVIHVGVIGVGNAGQGHIAHYKELPNVLVVGVADSDIQRAERVAGEFEIEGVYQDYHQLLEDPRLQVVSVTVPPFLHREVVVAAAERGIHVHCEKPLCLTLEDADEMISACKRHNVLLYVSFLPRQVGAYRRVQELLASGEYGEPLWMMDRRLLPAEPGVWMPPPWFWRRELGGGLLIENGGHHFDYSRWLMGEVKTVTAQTATLRFKESWPPYIKDPNIEDTALVSMTHESGRMSNLFNSVVAPCSGHLHLEVGTPTHYLAVDRTSTLTVERKGKVLFRTTFESGLHAIHSAHHIVECVRNGTQPNNTGEDGRAALELALAALESSRTQMPVTLPLAATPESLRPQLQAAREGVAQ
jgi:myo-inositol 2-dehydrogenase/D-chiro-inositol 1-dehydrogenase